MIGIKKTDFNLSISQVKFHVANSATLEATINTNQTSTETGPTETHPALVVEETVDVFSEAQELLDHDIGAIYVTAVGSFFKRKITLIEKMKKDDNFGDNLVLTTNLGNASSFITLDLADAELSISPDSVD